MFEARGKMQHASWFEHLFDNKAYLYQHKVASIHPSSEGVCFRI